MLAECPLLLRRSDAVALPERAKEKERRSMLSLCLSTWLGPPSHAFRLSQRVRETEDNGQRERGKALQRVRKREKERERGEKES